MAELTKIFTGMEKGPEAIQANFDLMNANIESNNPKVSDWVDLAMRNGFRGFARVRSTKYPSGKTKVDIYMEAGSLRTNQGQYMCDFPVELLPKKELPLRWAQPNNNDYSNIGASVGGSKTSIRLNFAGGGSGDLVVLFNLSYWLDV